MIAPVVFRARARRPRLSNLALALSSAALPATVLAQPALRETVVTATRVEQPLPDLLADVSIVDRATIERSGADGVADLLARLPGIQITRNGGIGSTTGVFLRGAETRFTAVYLDGVRVDTQTTGGAAWEAIPLALIDRIEVLRGPAAAVYGSDAIGGVVQLFTRKGEAGVHPSVGIGLGSRGTRQAEVAVSGASGMVDYALSAVHQESNGFNARPVTGANPDADGYNQTAFTGRIGVQLNARHRLDATLLHNDMKSDYDGFFHDPLQPVRDRNFYRLSTAGLGWQAQWTDAWRTRLSVSESRTRYETEPSYYETTTTLRNYLLQNELRLGAHLVTATLERREDRLRNPSDGFSATLDRERSQDGAALGYGWRGGAHTVQLNLRHDRDSEFGGKTTGSAAYGFDITPAWRVTASAGSAFRAPTLYQRFSEYGVSTLRPEEGRNAEAALRYAQGPVTASVTAYRNRVRNLITFDYTATGCDSFFGCYANTARARYQGVTLAGSWKLGGVTLRGSMDFQDPRDLDTGKQLTLRSRRYGTLGADWQVGNWTLGAELQAAGRRYANAANTVRMPGYEVVNLTASTRLTPDLSLVARLDNLFDRNYQLVNGYATAGRSLFVSLKWQPH